MPTGYGACFTGIEEGDSEVSTDARSSTLNFFCLRGPYLYLENWVDRDSLPPRQIAFPLEPNMSFEGEFYEIINTRLESRKENIGTLPCIDYEGIDRAISPFRDNLGAENVDVDMFQDKFDGGFVGAASLSQALISGLRGEELIPALPRDFNHFSNSYGPTGLPTR
ncbi:hypothetical protein CPB86DRAFT_183459 [Serendipita vermifera]|nr:hypothetical protein CPB86DRAFT_183459 [Serendipita vermifera]